MALTVDDFLEKWGPTCDNTDHSSLEKDKAEMKADLEEMLQDQYMRGSDAGMLDAEL